MDECGDFTSCTGGGIKERGIKVHDFIGISSLIEENFIPNENREVIIKDIDLNSEYFFESVIAFEISLSNSSILRIDHLYGL